MQVGVDVKSMHTNFGGRGLPGFGDKMSFKFVCYKKVIYTH